MGQDLFLDDEGAKFFQLVHMLQRTALFNLGHIPDHEKKIHFNMGEAKEAIDLINVLDVKTKGNLKPKEEGLLRSIVAELQLQFVQAPARQAKLEEQQAKSETIREAFQNPSDSPVEDLTED